MDKKTNQAKTVLVVGNSRSGTTMMGRLLGNHSQIFMFGELHYFGEICLPTDSMDMVMAQPKAINSVSRLLSRQREGYFNFDQTAPTHATEAAQILGDKGYNSFELYERFLQAETQRHGKSIPCDQTPRNLVYLKEILQNLDDVRVINMVRDPRGVLLSQKNRWKKRFFNKTEKIPFRQTLRNRINYHPVTSSLVWKTSILKGLEWENHPAVFHLQFEKFVEEPEKYTRQICDFLGLPYEAKMLEVPQKGSSNAQNTGGVGVEKSIASKWQEGGLTKGEIYLCQRYTQPLMRRLGYQPIEYKLPPLSVLYYWLILPFQLALVFLFNQKRYKKFFQAARRRFSK